jgi:short-subunit dehydrogenase
MGRAFENNVVILTGASLGIGAALARLLADQGAKLALASRNAEALEAVAVECRARGAETLAAPTDIADEAQCRALVEAAAARFGRIDTLINNAGISSWARFDEYPDLSILNRIMQVNFGGAAACTFHALPCLKQSRGRIVAINSLSGLTGVPLRTPYVASKHAMTGFFDSLRIELEGTGVSVTQIFPGFVSSGIHGRNVDAQGRVIGEGHAVDYTRAMTPERCAAIILRAAGGRRREVVMTPRAKFGRWLKLIAPGLVDRMALRAITLGR